MKKSTAALVCLLFLWATPLAAATEAEGGDFAYVKTTVEDILPHLRLDLSNVPMKTPLFIGKN